MNTSQRSGVHTSHTFTSHEGLFVIRRSAVHLAQRRPGVSPLCTEQWAPQQQQQKHKATASTLHTITRANSIPITTVDKYGDAWVGLYVTYALTLQTMLWYNNARVNSHQRWKQTRNRVCFHLWCELTSTVKVTEWQVSWNSYWLLWSDWTYWKIYN